MVAAWVFEAGSHLSPPSSPGWSGGSTRLPGRRSTLGESAGGRVDAPDEPGHDVGLGIQRPLAALAACGARRQTVGASRVRRQSLPTGGKESARSTRAPARLKS
jgi:hypothetical protein